MTREEYFNTLKGQELIKSLRVAFLTQDYQQLSGYLLGLTYDLEMLRLEIKQRNS